MFPHDALEKIEGASENVERSSGAYHSPYLPVTFLPLKASKKRDREEWFASSSDASLFSSDDIRISSAEKYQQHRHKRQHI